MAEVVVNLRFSSRDALLAGVTSLPEQLDVSSDLSSAHLLFVAKRGELSVLPSLEGQYIFSPRLQDFRLSNYALHNPRDDAFVGGRKGRKLAEDFPLGGKAERIWVSLDRELEDYRVIRRSPKPVIENFREGLLPKLIAGGYTPYRAELYDLKGSTWRIDRVNMLPRSRKVYEFPTFSMDVGMRDSRRWLARVFEATKDAAFYNLDYRSTDIG